MGQQATFTVVTASLLPLRYQWQKGDAPIAGATSSSYTTPPSTAADNGSQFSVMVSDSKKNIASAAATLTVNLATDVLTQRDDNARTGQNLTEAILTPANVNATNFGKIAFFPVDGLVDAEPLYASNVQVPGGTTHNLVVAATESDTVYGFDADSGATIWKTSMCKPGETAAPDFSLTGKNPNIGVNATPVIDRSMGPNGAVYVVATSATTQNGSVTYYQRLHALDLALGTELFGGPVDIQATYPGTGDNSDGTNVIFDPAQYRERVGLLLLNGVVYTTWCSHYDVRPYTGWLIGYNESTLQQAGVLNVTPNGNSGAIWMSDGGLAADTSGNIYFTDGNGVFDATLNNAGFPSQGDYGNAFIKVSTTGNQLAVADYFEMNNGTEESDADQDFGSGGALLLPDLTDASGQTVHLAIGAGKDTNLYIVDRDSMGKFSSNGNNIYQELDGILPEGVFATPAYFNNTVYVGSRDQPLLAFKLTNAKLPTNPTAQTETIFHYPGAAASISANGTNNAMVWVVENASPSVLHAYNASDLSELYNSNQAANGRDSLGGGNKFITPTIVNGKVYVGTQNGVAEFGLLP
jgi:hypothetical protein